jgi:hypothetical protein
MSAILPAIVICSVFSTGCWVPGRIYYELGYPKNLPDWPENDPSVPSVDFKMGDRFALRHPMLLEKNPIVKPPCCIVDPARKGGSSIAVETLPKGTVIRIVGLKDGRGSGAGIKVYFEIEGFEKYGWVRMFPFDRQKTRNGRNVYEYDRKWLGKLH